MNGDRQDRAADSVDVKLGEEDFFKRGVVATLQLTGDAQNSHNPATTVSVRLGPGARAMPSRARRADRFAHRAVGLAERMRGVLSVQANVSRADRCDGDRMKYGLLDLSWRRRSIVASSGAANDPHGMPAGGRTRPVIEMQRTHVVVSRYTYNVALSFYIVDIPPQNTAGVHAELTDLARWTLCRAAMRRRPCLGQDGKSYGSFPTPTRENLSAQRG
jgi:hypothetical protein